MSWNNIQVSQLGMVYLKAIHATQVFAALFYVFYTSKCKVADGREYPGGRKYTIIIKNSYSSSLKALDLISRFSSRGIQLE